MPKHLEDIVTTYLITVIVLNPNTYFFKNYDVIRLWCILTPQKSVFILSKST